MNTRRIWPKGWRAIVLLLVGSVMGASLLSPAVAHVGGTVTHLWGHLKPKVKTYGDGRWLKKTAQPGYNYNNNGDANALVGLTGSGASLTSVTLQAPAAGFAWVTGKAEIFITHANGTTDNVICKLSKTSGDVNTPSYGTGIVRIPSANPAGQSVDTVEMTRVFSVVAGPNTFHLNCYESSTTLNDGVLAPEIAGLFVGARYGTGPAPAAPLGGTGGVDRATG